MNNLLKNVSIFFGNRINVCIIVLMLFIILIYILNKDDDQIIIYNKQNNIHSVKQHLIPVNFPEGNYRIKNNKGILLNPNTIDKFGFNNKTNEQVNNENNFWKIKKYNNNYIFDKPDSKSCLSVQDGIIKELTYEECSKKSLCGIDNILNENDKIKYSYFNIYNTDKGSIISFNNKYLIFDENNINLTTNILEASPIIFENI